ncbi:MAG: hypothetical protein J7647_02255 [Cyanobacteria bacterium SBLK]|nr:hypothetical protein [Cyanobacteria bacterium SBLK]
MYALSWKFYVKVACRSVAMRKAIAQFLIILAENREAGRTVAGKGFRVARLL